MRAPARRLAPPRAAPNRLLAALAAGLALLLAVSLVTDLTAPPAGATTAPGPGEPAAPEPASAQPATPEPAFPAAAAPGWSGLLAPDAAAPLPEAAAAARTRSPRRVVAPPRAPLAERWTGLAFDACRAPSRRVMDRWRLTSPFLGVGIYIGGSLRACRQRHLTPGWVRHQLRDGWKLLPIWVGPQASCRAYRRTIPSWPGARGRYPAATATGLREARAAADAARRLRLGRGATLWYDLEWFPGGRRHCRKGALNAMSAWTEQLHREGFRAGVYSSVGAGIAALGRVRGDRRYTTPDAVWFAWANGRRDVRWRKYVDAPGWMRDRRAHQYQLDVVARYGGRRMAIDRNFVDLGSATAVRRAPAVCGRAADLRHFPALRRGSRGGRVAVLQCLLRARGQRPDATGRFGSATRSAVRAFQRQRGLRPSGRADERTWTALLASGPRPVLKRGSEGRDVRRVQRALSAALPGSVRVHGRFGPGTAHAVTRYQGRNGLRVTGVVTPGTWRALRRGEVVERRRGGDGRQGTRHRPGPRAGRR